MNRVIDLRSDTVTQPTPQMRRAMADAEVGDNYYGDDPTVKRLEARAAELLGKEAAMLVLSGTMGNLVSILTQVPSGSSIVVEESSHVFVNEGGHLAQVGGITARPVRGDRGFMVPDQIRAAVFPDSILHPPTRMLCLENTQNPSGGRCLSAPAVAALAAEARSLGLLVHVDGARIFNASVALGTPAADLVAPVDTITFCLTKGLGAPVGSVICGDRDVIRAAGRWRQMVGGGMRQAGVFAAAGLVALDTGIERLAEDHANARAFAETLASHGLPIDPRSVETNMLFVEIPEERMPAGDFVATLESLGVRINAPKGRRVRFVLHRDVDRADVVRAGECVGRVLDQAH